MAMKSDNSVISTPQELTEHITCCVDQFCRQMAFPTAVDIRIVQHPPENRQHPPRVSPLAATLDDRKLRIHLSEASLLGMSPLALQGWLDMELARRHLELEPELYRVNFDRDIRPHFYISGAGTHMVRHLVVHLETSLRNLIAAQQVIEIGHSEPLLYFFHYRITPSTAERENYQRLFPYHWIRAIFLCKKNKGFSPVALLADQGIAAELAAYWWNCHAYLEPEDKRFLQTLFGLSKHDPFKHFPETLVEMFKFVKTQLLLR